MGIIYEDDYMIIFNKPSGMLVQADRSFDVDVVSHVMTYLAGKPENKGLRPQIHVINRLDRPVSGLVLLAKNKEWAARLTKELTSGKLCKDYLAVIQGEPLEKKGEFRDYLLKDSKSNTSKVVPKDIKDAKEAVLEYEVLKTKIVEGTDGEQRRTLVKVHLITGRHHQIRVQFSSRGLPLLGDVKYGEVTGNKSIARERAIALCSYHLQVLGKDYVIQPSGAGFEYFSEELETI
ncbi:MAG: RluA family pseudouridine synthase [Lachnospiraceae bacterium]